MSKIVKSLNKNIIFFIVFAIIALIATALISSCGSPEKTENAVQQAEKPKVKIAQVYTEDVAQLEEYATTVEAEVKNNIIPNSPLKIAKILLKN